MTSPVLPLEIQLLSLAVLIAFSAWVGWLIRHQRLHLRESLIWLVTTLLAILITAFPNLLVWAARVLGIRVPANALFGALQVQTAAKAGLDPVLLAAANSSGGVLGKMVSPQNLAIAAAAVGLAGKEGDIFRKVLGWSMVLLVLMCVIVVLQATPVLSWMIP